MKPSTLYSIEDKAKTKLNKKNIKLLILILSFLNVIGNILMVIDGTHIIITLFLNFFLIIPILIIVVPFYLLHENYATSMMVNELGIFSYNNKNELIETILYENILIIQLYDTRRRRRYNTNPNLHIKVNDNGTIIWKTFPKLYYIELTNKNELHLHFLQQAKASQNKIKINPNAFSYYHSLVKK